MRRVFADTYYWIALLNDRDQGHAAAEAISLTLQQATLITTQEVLSEVLTFFCEEGQYVQQAVAAYVGYGNDSRQTGPLRVPPSLQQSGRYPASCDPSFTAAPLAPPGPAAHTTGRRRQVARRSEL